MGVPPTVPGIPDRHSSPASPRVTAAATSGSHGSPAPAISCVWAPRGSKRTPLTCMCRTRASTPPSATTMLLPPPRTIVGNPRSRLHSCAAATALAVSARTYQRAEPPTPSVVWGARSTCGSGDASVPSPSSDGKQLSFLPHECGHCLGARADLELDPVAGCKLSGKREIRRDDGGDLRIPPGRLAVCHQQDWFA